MKHSSQYDIRLSKAEAITLYKLVRRLSDEQAFTERLDPSEQAIVAGLAEVLDDALHARSGR